MLEPTATMLLDVRSPPIADAEWRCQPELMIARSEMFPPLLEADPTFKRRWQAFVTGYADEPELPLYIALGELAEHLIERQQRGDTQGFEKVFDVVERWHMEGDFYVSEAASIGFLESL